MVEPDVDSLNRLCDARGWPRSLDDKGHLAGVWYCGTYNRQELYGAYPPTYLARLLALFPDVPESELLHCPSGALSGPGVTVDMVSGDGRCPQIVANAAHLPFRDNAFSLLGMDPPYSQKHAKVYGTGRFPIRKAIVEAWRVLRPGGMLAILHIYQPNTNRQMWRTRGLIAVVCGPHKDVRLLTLMQKQGWQLATGHVPNSGAKRPLLVDMPLFAAREET